MFDPLHNRWLALVKAIREECLRHSQDPGVLTDDESALRLSLPLDVSTQHAVTLSRELVLRERPEVLAAEFYKSYIAASDEWRSPL
jgi:hypothetical protein